MHDPEGGRSIERVQVAESLQGTAGAREIARAIELSQGDPPATSPPRAQIVLRDINLSVASAPLGRRGEIGTVAAGSVRSDFPTQTERLLLDVAANQATVSLQQTRLVRESERNSRQLVDSIPGLVALLTAGGEVEFVNRQIIEYTGRTLQELKHWGTDDTVHPDDLPRVVQAFTRSIASGSPYEIVQRLRRSDGVYLWFQNNGFPLRDASGHIVRWCVLLTDIDERKRAEDALRESERESRLIVDSIPGLVATFTAVGEVEFVNRQVLEYYGKTLEELKRWETTDATHPEDLPRAVELDALNAALRMR
jgi:PAS domain S-box-containing protein